MKKLIVSAALLCSLAAAAQVKEGRVVYERVFQMPTRSFAISGGGDAPPPPPMPRTMTTQFELLFSGNKSLWQNLPSATEGGDGSFAGGGMVIRMAGMNDITYVDLDNGTSVSQREEFDRSFLVSDTLAKLSWKMTEETKTILNYTARKAVATRIGNRTQRSMENGEMKVTTIPDTSKVIAWFTTDVPVSVGPEYPANLPGLILQLELNNGQTVYTAVEVSPKVNTAKIKAPKEGKKMTAAEFRKERQKMLEELQRNAPNGMQFRIQQ